VLDDPIQFNPNPLGYTYERLVEIERQLLAVGGARRKLRRFAPESGSTK